MNQKNSPTSVVGQYLASPGRAWFDRSFPHLASYPIGKEVPDACIPLTGNTTVKLDIISMLQTNPTPTPVFDSARCNVRVFFVPQRLYVRGLQNDNYMETDEIEGKQLPLGRIGRNNTPYVKRAIIPYGSLMNRLGYPASIVANNAVIPLNPRLYFDEDTTKTVVDFTGSPPQVNMSSVCAYYDVCTYFLANPYDKDIPFDTPSIYLNKDSNGNLKRRVFDDFEEVTYYNIKDIQATLQAVKGIFDTTLSGNIPAQLSLFSNQSDTGANDNPILYFGTTASSAIGLTQHINTELFPLADEGDTVVSWTSNSAYDIASVLGSYSSTVGLFPATYIEDYQSTWFDIDDINSLNAVKLTYTDGGTNLDEVRIKQSIWNRMLRTILRGKRLSDWTDVQFGRKLSLSNHPIMVGADSFDITWDDVLSHNANQGVNGDGSVPLGGAAGRGKGGSDTRSRGKRDRTITFTTQEPGYLLIIRDIVPYVSYPDARARHWDYTVMADFPLPMYSGKTFQDLAVSDILVTSDKETNNTVVGKQPVYYDYMTGTYTLGGLMQTSLYDSYTFKRVPNLNDMSVENSETNVRSLRSTYVLRSMYDFQFTDWSQNNGENIFIKSYYNLRCFQPLDKQVIKTRL